MKQPFHSHSTHDRINTVLIVCVFLLGVYILVIPFWPVISLWWQQRFAADVPAYVEAVKDPTKTTGDIPQDNRLVIPQLFIDAPIQEGKTIAAAAKGPWHKPQSSTPDAGGNMVIAGHRFTYRNQSVFYHLDKLAPGDRLAIYWQGTAYHYIVTTTKVVKATETSIEAPTGDNRLTLYTCTPLWSAKDRLVVTAKRVEERNNAL